MAKVRITFKAISDEKQIMNQPQANQLSIHVAAVQLLAEI